MSIRFKVVSRPNPQDRSLAPKHYAMAVRKEVMDLDDLAELMSDGGTLRASDIYAVLVSLVSVVSREIRNGNQVNLGKLGSFYVSINSEGKDNPDEVGGAQVKKANLRYRPTQEIKNLLSTLKYEKESPPTA